MPLRQYPSSKTAKRNSDRQRPVPKIWLMTDARFGDTLLAAVQALPMGSGVVFRHYHLAPNHRLGLFRKIRAICRRRGHMILLAAPPKSACKWDIDGMHNHKPANKHQLYSASVHNRNEMRKASHQNADLCFVSPVYKTKTHPGARTIGPLGLKRLAGPRSRNGYVIALGGMNRSRAGAFRNNGIYGWAGIEALVKRAKHKL